MVPSGVPITTLANRCQTPRGCNIYIPRTHYLGNWEPKGIRRIISITIVGSIIIVISHNNSSITCNNSNHGHNSFFVIIVTIVITFHRGGAQAGIKLPICLTCSIGFMLQREVSGCCVVGWQHHV